MTLEPLTAREEMALAIYEEIDTAPRKLRLRAADKIISVITRRIRARAEQVRDSSLESEARALEQVAEELER